MKDRVRIRVELDAGCVSPEVVIRTAQRTGFVENLVSVIERYAKSDVPRIAVSEGSSTVLLEQTEILRVYTEPRKLLVCASRGTFEARCSLKEMEKTLAPECFVRISRFELINMERVSGFDMGLSGTIRVTFDDGSSTFVARRYVRTIEQRLDQLYARGGQADE